MTTNHPHTLTTEEDYKAAPSGTIIAKNEGAPYYQRGRIWIRGDTELTHLDMLGTSRHVLRWGWEA